MIFNYFQIVILYQCYRFCLLRLHKHLLTEKYAVPWIGHLLDVERFWSFKFSIFVCIGVRVFLARQN